MDNLLHLIDNLEELIAEARRMPIGQGVVVDRVPEGEPAPAGDLRREGGDPGGTDARGGGLPEDVGRGGIDAHARTMPS